MKVGFGTLLLLTACVPPRVSNELALLEARVAALEAASRAEPAVDEEAAAALLTVVTDAVAELRYDDARAALAELSAKYPGSRAARSGERVAKELAIVGKPAELAVDFMFQGEAPDLAHGTTVLVFWEAWCPHCKRELPKLQETATRYGDRLRFVGLTRMTKDVDEAQVRAFLTENAITFPIGRDRGEESSTYYGVSGIPAAVVTRDGVVVWRGHPAKLEDALIERLITP